MVTRYSDDEEIDKYCLDSPSKRISPTTFAILIGFGIGQAVNWILARQKEHATEQAAEKQASYLQVEATGVAKGPWGGSGGHEFYHGRGEIVGITVHYDENAVVKLQVTYEQNGLRFQGEPHGGTGGESTTISLQYPVEFLQKVVGTTAPDQTMFGTEMVTSLTFITNMRTYGPFGHERGTKFETGPGKEVVGFYGRSGGLLDRLGVLMKPQWLARSIDEPDSKQAT